MEDLYTLLRTQQYSGRGIILGTTPSGKVAAAYFIMGRSENSRNRIFVEEGEGIRTEAFDPSKLEDPSLIIYAPVRVLGNKTIVTNGDQTDTIYDGMDRQNTFEQSLRSREFEPDGPNYTPRISGIMHIENGHYNYAMSILKSNNGDDSSCNRYTFAYENPKNGEGRFIHTYMGMTLRENQRDYYFDRLEEHFEGLKDRYIKTYGERYNCVVPNYKYLFKVFAEECNKYGILYKMEDIIKAYKKDNANIEQISFF